MTKSEVQFIHVGCGGEMRIVDVTQHEYWDGDAHNTYIEFRCKKCNGTVEWEDIEARW